MSCRSRCQTAKSANVKKNATGGSESPELPTSRVAPFTAKSATQATAGRSPSSARAQAKSRAAVAAWKTIP